ncbi:DUF3883 domain-containing protein [Owenweeksia hongkongensis]|uniref:DUF3883 domain-containing protein n=1 Tax=Owenweeksia hongkongensis TaxID=253245 RepID=UPI003A93A632
MKLAVIEREHIIEAANYIDFNGIPSNYISNNYWVALPNGREYPFKYLTRIAYQFVEGHEAKWLDFESNKSYRGYVQQLGFEIKYYSQAFSFIHPEEVIFYSSVAGRPYRKTDESAVRKGLLLKPLISKLNVWAKESLVEDFQVKSDKSWQWSGTYKSYLWLRITRPDANPKVYFVIGCMGDGNLYMELNCQRSNHSGGTTKPLSPDKVSAFDHYLHSSNYSPKVIEPQKLKNYSWDRLIAETKSFLLEYAGLYDELEQLVSGDEKGNEPAPSGLSEEVAPDVTKSYANRERIFQGRDINWQRKLGESSALGTSGESLVIAHEKRKLNELGLYDEAEKVVKVNDGEGYDIKSFDEHGSEIHIEVKTTMRQADEPFYMSINEQAYFTQHPKGYFLFRVYEYNAGNNTGKFYKKNADELLEFTFSPTNFEVSIQGK